MSNIFITTTGVTPSVILSDLGYRVITHPTINYNLGSEFTYNELTESGDFNNSLSQGYLTASYNGSIITSATAFVWINNIGHCFCLMNNIYLMYNIC